MRSIKLIPFIIAFAVILNFGTGYALKYSIDGDVSDWGIDLSLATSLGYLDTHKPDLPTFNIMTEDNDDNTSDSDYNFVGPGYSFENKYDAEAIYFDNDETYGYIAIITGVRPDGWVYGPGDIGIDVDPAANVPVVDGVFDRDPNYNSSTPYEFAITMDGALVKVSQWNSVKYTDYGYDEAGPYSVNTIDQTVRSAIDFAYSTEEINDHYVIEAAFLLEDLGLEPHDTFSINWTMGCGNDYVRLEGARVHTPEPTTFLLFGSGLLGLASFVRKGKMKKV